MASRKSTRNWTGPTPTPTPTLPSPMDAMTIELIAALRGTTALTQYHIDRNEGTDRNPNSSNNNNKRKFGGVAEYPHKNQYVGTLPKCNKCTYHHIDACRVLLCDKCKRKGHTARCCRSQTQETMTSFATTTATVPTRLNQYVGILPKCDKCIRRHTGACRKVSCSNCKWKGHTARLCNNPVQGTNQPPRTGENRACWGCGEAGHIKKDCPKTKGPRGNGLGMVLAIVKKEEIEEPAVVTGTFLINNSYVCVLFIVMPIEVLVSY